MLRRLALAPRQAGETWGNGQSDDPVRHVDELESQLQGELRSTFLQAAGCDVDPAVRRVLEVIVAYKSVPEADAVPGILDEQLAPAECTAIVEYLKRLRLIDLDGEDLRPNAVISRLLAQP